MFCLQSGLFAGCSILILSTSAMAADNQELQPVPEAPRELAPDENLLIDPPDPNGEPPQQPERIGMSRACIGSPSLNMTSGLSFRVRSRDGEAQGTLIPHQDGIRLILGSGSGPGDMRGITRIKPQEPLSANTNVLFDAFNQKKAVHINARNPQQLSRRWVYDVWMISLTYADCE